MTTQRYIQKEEIVPLIAENPTIVEAGGHTGRDAIAMSAVRPEGHIYTFEPVPHLFEKLEKNVALHANITAYNSALSTTTGTTTLYTSSSECDAVSSVLPPKLFSQKRPDVTFTAQTASCITIDDWAQKNGVTQVDLLWLDLQGHELAVMQASPIMLKTVTAIHIEVNLEERFAGAPLYDTVRAWLESQGFAVVKEALYRGTWGNVLFVRR